MCPWISVQFSFLAVSYTHLGLYGGRVTIVSGKDRFGGEPLCGLEQHEVERLCARKRRELFADALCVLRAAVQGKGNIRAQRSGNLQQLRRPHRARVQRCLLYTSRCV